MILGGWHARGYIIDLKKTDDFGASDRFEKGFGWSHVSVELDDGTEAAAGARGSLTHDRGLSGVEFHRVTQVASVTRLGDFLKFLVTIFLTKVVEILDDFLGFLERHHF